MSGRCQRHELALGPRGCVLCRREAAATGAASVGSSVAPDSMVESEPRQVNIHVPPWIFLLPIAALAFYYAFAGAGPHGPAVASLPITQPEPRVNRAAVSAERAEVDKPPAAAAASEEVAWQRGDAPPSIIASERAPTSGPEAPDAREARPPAVILAREQAEGRELAASRELAAARQDVDVIVYFTEWCPACRSVRGYLAERGIRSVEYDVDKDRRAKSRQRQLNPKGSIPTIDIEGQILVGFSAQRIEQAIDRAARARIARLQQGL